jgi:hypothetical protein
MIPHELPVSGEYPRALAGLGAASVLSVTAKRITFAGPSLIGVILHTSLNSRPKTSISLMALNSNVGLLSKPFQ